MLDELLGLMAAVFEVQPGELSADTQFGDLPKWDSMGHMDLMVALETKYGIEINADSIRDLVSVQAIMQAAEAKTHG